MENKSLIPTLQSSALAGIISRILLHPIDTCKVKIQTNTQLASSRGLIPVVSSILRTEGLFGLYRGFLPALAGTIPGVSLYFLTFETSKGFLDKQGVGISNSFSGLRVHFTNFVCGFLAETVSCVVWVPTDVVKERSQVLNKTTSNFSILNQIFRQDGVRGLYRGYGATLASFGPFSALYFMFVEQFKLSGKVWLQNDKLDFHHLVLMCALSGGLAALLTAPLDLVKVRMQVQNSANYTVISGLRGVWRSEGWKGLFRGGSSRVWFAVPNTALTMATMESIKNRLY